MSYTYETAQELANKVDWEGGISSALDYGIRADEIGPEELRVVWAEMEQAWSKYAAMRDRVHDMLPEPGDEE